MRTYELRIYTLASDEAVDAYLTVYYPNHEKSLATLFDVTVHGYWSPVNTDAAQVYALFSYPEGANPAEVRKQYLADLQSAENMPGFDPSIIRSVSVTLLTPAAASPLF